MKHIKLFEQFINESLKAKKPNDIIEIDIDFAGSDSDLRKLSKKHKLEVDEYQSGMVLLKGKKKDILDKLKNGYITKENGTIIEEPDFGKNLIY